MKIHLSYSDRFFHPEKDYSHYQWHITSRIAKHVWEALSKNFAGVTYGDSFPQGPLDILWTNRLIRPIPQVNHIGYIASVAHYSYVYYRIKQYQSLADSKPEGLYPWRERWLYYRTYANADVVLYPGNDRIADSFKMFPHPYGASFIHTNWGLDYDYFKPQMERNRDDLIFLYCCTRFTIRKGSHFLPEVWEKISRKFSRARLMLIARDGDYDLWKRLRNNPSVKRINVPSFGDQNYLEALSKAKWIVLPSLAEGQAGSLLEAMSCGCVPIASLDTGINADEYHGYVVEPNNSENLEKIMEQAINDWKPELPLLVRKIIKQKHKWSDFESKILDATQYLTSLPAQRRKNKTKIAIWFFWNDILRTLSAKTYQ